MSGGFLPDLASWALGGGAGNDNEDNNNNNNNNNDSSTNAAAASSNETLTEAEVRARRLARMEALASSNSGTTNNDNNTTNTSMDVDAVDESMDISPPRKSRPSSSTSLEKDTGGEGAQDSVSRMATPPVSLQSKKKAKESHTTGSANAATAVPLQSPTDKKMDDDQNNLNTVDSEKSKSKSSTVDPKTKLQRKKEILLQKVLHISLKNGIASSLTSQMKSFSGLSSSSPVISIALDDDKIAKSLTVHSIAEILALRLALPVADLPMGTKALLPYLMTAHVKATEELKTVQSKKVVESDLVNLLEEIQRQVVSYAASSLMEPDLFEQGKDGILQLVKALHEPEMTLGLSGPSSSFYSLLCDELHGQDEQSFRRVIRDVIATWMGSLKKCDSLDAIAMGGDTSPMGLVGVMTGICSHKKAALAVAESDAFLVPAEGSQQASEMIQPPIRPGADILRMFSPESRPYKRRSGPGIEKETVLGLVLRIAPPKANPAFSPGQILRQSLDTVERATNQQRQQLQNYQNACHQLIMAIIKGGPDARQKVLQWFLDCQQVNTGATAMRPDLTKVASPGLLLNVSVALFKLCDPFLSDDKKQKLVDPLFVVASPAGKELFPSEGDNALSQLGESSSSDSDENAVASMTYQPKNTFIPQVFFLAARSMALGIVPQLSSHENLLRNISHQHWELNQQNRDIYSDPHFSMYVSRQRSNEVALFQEDMTTDSIRVLNLMAKVLMDLRDDVLRQMPEHFVENMCSILMGIAKLKPRSLRGMDVRYVFSLMVKLLSPSYKSMVRNYNLRAMMGDVLHEIFLPSSNGDRRDIPASVTEDPLAGGRTYLLSNTTAQKTLAPSLLLLYGEVEHTGYYDKMSHRAKISSLLKYLWESSEHRPAFREITQNKESFIKFANGIINETNHLISTVMQKLPEIKTAQDQMADTAEWSQLNEEEQGRVQSRLDDNEREVKHALPLCNKTIQMFVYLNTDKDIRSLFLLDELCPRLVNMLVHVLGKIVGTKGLHLKVKNPESYDFRPKEMLRDLCAIFALFAYSSGFQVECAKNGCRPDMLRSAVKTCQKEQLLLGESMKALESLPDLVEQALRTVEDDEALMDGAPDEFLDEILTTFMKDPVILPSGHFVDRSTITQHLLNDPIDPFNREAMTIDDIKPATELKAKIESWLADKRAAQASETGK